MCQYKLTICIPTYNRLMELQECLDSVIPQMNDSIEIFVSDNSTNDKTEDYINSIIGNYDNFRYKHNKENLGADGNFLQCLQMANGEYVMLLADDDKLKNDCVEHIINFIDKKNEVDFIELNSLTFVGEKYNFDKHFLEYSEPIVFEDDKLNDFFGLMGIMFTFSSTMLFNKKSFEQVENPKQYSNTNLLQCHIAIKAMLRLKKVAIIPNAMVFERGDNSGGYNIYKVFIKNWKDVLNNAYKTGILSRKMKNKIFSNTIEKFVTGWLIDDKLQGLGSYKTNKKIKWFTYAFFTKGAWTRLYPVWIMPNWLLKKLLEHWRKSQKNANMCKIDR